MSKLNRLDFKASKKDKIYEYYYTTDALGNRVALYQYRVDKPHWKRKGQV